MSAESGYATESMLRSMRDSAGARQKVPVSPALMRNFMQHWNDPADLLFKQHRERLYQVMEMRARDQKFHAEYSVLDNANATEAALQEVYCRLVAWLRKKNFHVRASSTRPRALVVSWDPVEAPQSVTEKERHDKQSVAATRLKWAQRQQTLNSPATQSMLASFGFAANQPASGAHLQSTAQPTNQRQQRDEDFLGDLLAAPSTQQLFGARPQTSVVEQRALAVPRHVAARTKRTVQRAAAVAGARDPLLESGASDTTGRSLTRSSDERSE